MKNKYILALCLSFFCILSVGTLLSYLTDKEEAKNPISIGQNTIEIIEEFTKPDDLKPGDTFFKKPRVKNTGSVPCYVRMFVEFSDAAVADVATINFDTTKWTEKQADGYYYYKSIVNPNVETQPLFTKVTIDANAQEDIIQSFDILVYAESVQSENYTSYSEAFNALEP